jgi:hypothetical protein
MALKTTKWDLADSFRDQEDIYDHLRVEFEDYEPRVMTYVLDAILRARGGASVVASETGIPASAFTNLATMDESAIHDLATRLMEAYRPAVSSTKVA